MEGTELYARHLLVCHDVIHDPDRPGSSYTLRGLIVSLRPEDDYGYPFVYEQLWVFAQLFGETGQHNISVEVVWLDPDGGGDVAVARFGPWVVRVSADRFIEVAYWRLRHVAFPRPGLYEFRLWAEGRDEPVIAERVLLENP